jgi:hypothetical protein
MQFLTVVLLYFTTLTCFDTRASSSCNSAGTEKLPDDDALAPKHVATMELSNKTVKKCFCWLFINTQNKIPDNEQNQLHVTCI